MKGRIYRHYKGACYRVIEVAKHTEDETELVIYRALQRNSPNIWARPREMFEGLVTLPSGEQVPRFEERREE